jgi:hypothetical protein
VEEGRPFCPHCGAPLIRVIVTEPVTAGPALPGTSSASQESSGLSSSQTVPVLAVPRRWSQTFKPCFLAALVAMGLMMLRLYPFIAILSAGFLAVAFYRQRRQDVLITPASGARLGALAGFLCFCIMAVLSAVAAAVPELRGKMQAQITENFQKVAASRPPDPQIQSLLDAVKTPEGLAAMLVFAGIALLVVSLILGVLGGAVGGQIFKPRNRS